jgi:hypothetical protein
MKNTGTPTTPATIMELPSVSYACDDASAMQVLSTVHVFPQQLCQVLSDKATLSAGQTGVAGEMIIAVDDRTHQRRA